MKEEKLIIADLHVHSKYSKATSKEMGIETLERYAKIKGVGLLGTGDFQHPLWFKELETLHEEQGILYTKNGFPFVWQTEISLMYNQNNKCRRVHYIILSPNKEVTKQIIEFLGKKGRLEYDGRPIFGFSSIELVDEMQRISEDIEIIPAHSMTPWFGIFGSKTGFDSLKECFQEKTNKIHAIESGMSADPKMLRGFSFLNDKSIVSFSDSHSFWPWRLGREATIFNMYREKLRYEDIIKQIRENSFKATIETPPEYGKYHFDGHRFCNFSSSPKETKDLNGICPVCKKPLTIGVEFRVEQLSDNPEDFKLSKEKKYYKLLPLHELISFIIGSTFTSQKTWRIYNSLIESFGNELNVLINTNKEDLLKCGINEKLAGLIIKNRNGTLEVKPGFDGQYGQIMIKEEQKKLVV